MYEPLDFVYYVKIPFYTHCYVGYKAMKRDRGRGEEHQMAFRHRAQLLRITTALYDPVLLSHVCNHSALRK